MYYYIMEPPSSRAVRQTYQRLRDLLTNLGIAGEMMAASPARTPEELAMMGLERGYSTIVAVGGDAFVNYIAQTIIGQAVLGIIPIGEAQQSAELIGTNNMKTAAEFLKFRRLSTFNTVTADPDSLIFLDAVVEPPKLAKVSFVIDGKLRGYAYFNKMTVTRNLEIKIESQHLVEPKKFLGLFSTGGTVVQSLSQFHGRNVRLTTEPDLALLVDGRPVAKTPLQLRLNPNSLKVITKRGSIL
ncbi:MAG: diacylglycerol kinase family protein [Candidatus Berkelbacteria bacterium]|nr:diacylglycerol kinase family protein [Candidatus Berkelbacteria bacterium]